VAFSFFCTLKPIDVIISAMKRLLIIALLIVLAITTVGAKTVEELYEEVVQKSEQYNEIQLSRRSEFIDSVLASLKGPSWEVSLQDLRVSAQKNFLAPAEIGLPSLNVSYTAPELEGGLRFDTAFNIGGMQYSWDTKKNLYTLGDMSISMRSSLSKSFQFKSWDSTDYSKGLSETLSKSSYQKRLLEFENTFLEELIVLLTNQKEINEKKYLYDKAAEDYSQAVDSGKLDPESPDGIKALTDAQIAQREYEQVIESVEDIVAQFKKTYGVSYDGNIDSSKRYEVEYTPTPGGNLTVYSKYVDYLMAKQKIDEKIGTSSSLDLSMSVEPKVNYDKNLLYKDTSLASSINTSFKTGHLNIDASLSGGFSVKPNNKSEWGDGPTLTISATWSNTPSALTKAAMEKLRSQYTTYDRATNSYKFNQDAYESTLRGIYDETVRRESLEIEQLEAAMVSARIEWESALTDYSRLSSALQREIKDFTNAEEILKIRTEGNKKIRQQTEKLLNEGKASADEYTKAVLAEEADILDLVISNIRSHILYNRILILEEY